MKVIDVHCHIAPASCLPMEAIARDGRTYGLSVGHDSCGGNCPIINGQANRNCDADQLYDVERRLREMDDAGVDIQVLSPVTFFYFYNLPPDEAAERARRVNRGIADIAAGRPDRFRGMATVPMQDPERAVDELVHAVKDLGLHGVEISSNVDGRNLDKPDFRPFFETVQRLDVPVFIHPENVAAADRLQRYYLRNLIGNPLDTAICLASLIFGGVFDEFPDLKMIVAHGGGVAPILAGRWNHGQQVRSETKLPERAPADYLRDLYYDTITHDTAILRNLCNFVGPSRVLLGTDYPFDMGDTDPLKTTAAIPDLTAADLEDIRGNTAARLYGIEI